MKEPIRFDDALPVFANIVSTEWGPEALESNFFLRDGAGKLTFVVIDESDSERDRSNLARDAESRLGAYVESSRYAVLTPEELFDDSLRRDPPLSKVRLDHAAFSGSVKLLDRRVVGADWLRSPSLDAQGPKRFVFASLKGGVGRSTSLCVIASEFARRGKRVLAIDMDMEAPGLGNFILADNALPEFGLLDYFVENEVGQPTDRLFLADMVGSSWLGGGVGRVDVIPALGTRSIRNPANVLAKIARAYLAETDGQEVVSFADRMSKLVDSIAGSSRYDLILIDARAGLHETTAAALLRLGADVLLFGMDQTQTYQGFEVLFSHIGTLQEASVLAWRDRLTLIHGRATSNPKSRDRFAEKAQDLAERYLRAHAVDFTSAAPELLRETFNVVWQEPHVDPVGFIESEERVPVIVIPDDERFRDFDPLLDRSALESPSYLSTYSDLIQLIEAGVESGESTETL